PHATACTPPARSYPEYPPHHAGPAYKTTATTPIPPSGIRSLANFLPSASAPHYTAAPGNKAAGSSLAPPGSTCKTGDFPFPTHAARLGCAAPTIGAERSPPRGSDQAVHGCALTALSTCGTQWDRGRLRHSWTETLVPEPVPSVG